MPYRPAKRHQQRIVSWNKSETGPSPFSVMAYFRGCHHEGAVRKLALQIKESGYSLWPQTLALLLACLPVRALHFFDS